ncbi:CCE_0567 family metalloprotein [Nitrogeniibacter aestuarii]|uniref:CCE_0567 family metalloprotein n=1 Tax=Nitrogeniibacter aestuarii TaxID=2815343 RepID=UPI001D12FF88|nr:CCE_0567 family metalloprotein [Nitrogeniibacter aestuarii]
MTDEELKALEKEVKKLKRISAEKASELHDLVEDRLPAAYDDIPVIAQTTYDACKAWADANARLQAALSEVAS